MDVRICGSTTSFHSFLVIRIRVLSIFLPFEDIYHPLKETAIMLIRDAFKQDSFPAELLGPCRETSSISEAYFLRKILFLFYLLDKKEGKSIFFPASTLTLMWI
jgi:hypothetical protein